MIRANSLPLFSQETVHGHAEQLEISTSIAQAALRVYEVETPKRVDSTVLTVSSWPHALARLYNLYMGPRLEGYILCAWIRATDMHPSSLQILFFQQQGFKKQKLSNQKRNTSRISNDLNYSWTHGICGLSSTWFQASGSMRLKACNPSGPLARSLRRNEITETPNGHEAWEL